MRRHQAFALTPVGQGRQCPKHWARGIYTQETRAGKCAVGCVIRDDSACMKRHQAFALAPMMFSDFC
jgi:hypothetical protein